MENEMDTTIGIILYSWGYVRVILHYNSVSFSAEMPAQFHCVGVDQALLGRCSYRAT